MSLRILVVTPTPTHPCNAGNRVRIMNLVDALRQQGHQLHLIHLERERGDGDAMSAWLGKGRFRRLPYRGARRMETRWQRLKRRVHQVFDVDARHVWGIDDWYDPALTGLALQWHGEVQFDVVIVEYVFLSRLLEAFDDTVLKIIDTHDRFANRHRLYLAQGLPPQFFSTTPENEQRGLDRADIVLAIQETERSAFARDTRAEVLAVGHLVRVEGLHRQGMPEAGCRRVLILGSDNPINLTGLSYFCNEVWPLIRAGLPDATLVIAGGLSRHIEDQNGIERQGFVDDIATVYRGVDLAVNPVGHGTGLNIKSIESLGFGVPLVTTLSGSRGLEHAIGRGMLVAETPEAFSRTVIALLTDSGLRSTMALQAIEFANEWNAASLESLETAFHRAIARRST